MSFLGLFERDGVSAPARVEPSVSAGASSDVSNPAAWMQEIGFGGVSRISGLPRVSPDLAQKHGTVTASCAVIAGDLSKLPLHIYQRKDGIKVRVKDHPLEYLLNVESSPRVSARVMRFGLGYSFSLRGRAYAFAPRDGGGEIDLIDLVHPDCMMVLRSGRDRFYEFEDGAGVRRRVSGRVMAHLRYMSEDGWEGRSPIQVAAETLGIALAGQEAAARGVSGKSAKWVAKVGSYGADDEALERDRRRLRNAMRDDGDGAGVILGHDDELKELGLSAVDLQLLEGRKFDREMIAGLYRVPPFKLQMLENGVKANGEQQALDYRSDCLTHWGGFVEAELSLGLLTEAERRAGMFIRHNYDAFLQSTTKERYEAHGKAVGGPFKTVNEVRKKESLPPIEGGDVLYPPPNMTAESEGDKGKSKGDDE